MDTDSGTGTRRAKGYDDLVTRGWILVVVNDYPVHGPGTGP